jgi:hypothetical protein
MVIHELFKGSKTAAETPGLDPKVFDIDKKVIVIATTLPYAVESGDQPVTFMPTDGDFGAMAWSEECEKKITGLIK